MKRYLSWVLVITILITTCGSFVYAKKGNSPDSNVKITDELKEAMNNLQDGEKIPVYVILYDLDADDVINAFAERYPEEYAEYDKAKNGDMSEIMEGITVEPDKGKEYDDSNYIDPINGELLQSAIELKRSVYREYYNEWNHSVIDKYIAKDDQIFVSQYSQLMIVNANKNDIINLSKDDKVFSLDLFVDHEAVNEMVLADEVTRADYVRDNFGNKGSGVKIGMIEANNYKPNSSDSYLAPASVYIDSSVTLTTHAHATRVARILVGSSYGIAPSAVLYCTGFNDVTSFYDRMENYLLNNGVNVINMSAGFLNADGTYDILSKWVDHLTFNHDVHFVKSAGNRGEGDTFITSPGMGYNIITVGGFNTNNTASNGSHTIYSRSSYTESGVTRPEKPNLIAPASTYNPTLSTEDTCGLNFGDARDHGTSFSAPQVTGIIAQICGCASSLKTKQTAVGAILTASCEHKINRILRTGSNNRDYLFVSGDSIAYSGQQISNREGAGKVDARNARWMAYNGRFWRYTISTNAFPYTKTFTQSASTTGLVRVAIFWLRHNTLSAPHTNPNNLSVDAFGDLDLEVIGPNGTSVGSCKTIRSNYEVVQFVPTVGGTYTIKITLSNSTNTSENVGIALW